MPINWMVLILSSLFLYIKSNKTIIFPLKNSYEETHNINDLLNEKNSYIIIEIGTPPKNVPVFFSDTHNGLNITNEKCPKLNIYNNNYDINKSSSYNSIALENSDNYLSNDTFHFYTNMNKNQEKISVQDFSFFINKTKSDNNFCGDMGLKIKSSIKLKYLASDFTQQLKRLEVVDNDYYSFFHYNNKDYLFFGEYLHKVFLDVFDKNASPIWIHPLVRKNYQYCWDIRMKDIYYNNNHIKTNVLTEINPLIEFVVGDYFYETNITNDYFNRYFQKNICQIENHEKYKLFICNKEKFTLNDINKFPVLKFANYYLNYEFIFNGSELFKIYDNKYYFQIIFPINEEVIYPERWIFGKIFLRKYSATFSPDRMSIAFYRKIENKDTNEKKDYKDKEDEIPSEDKDSKSSFEKIILNYGKVIIFAFIFICLGIYIGKKIYSIRRKRAYEY